MPAFPDRFPIHHTPGDESADGRQLSPLGGTEGFLSIRHTSGDVLVSGFSPNLSWSHYRALLSVEYRDARDFYECEAAECGWTKSQLERQIQSSYFQRIVANRGKDGLVASDRERLPGEPTLAEAILKTPYVLEFQGLPDSPTLHESDLEQAIIDNLQSFLLELGKGYLPFSPTEKELRLELQRERKLIEAAIEDSREDVNREDSE